MGSRSFGLFVVRHFFLFTVSKHTRMFVLKMKSKAACKEIVSDSLGLVNFAIGLVNTDGQVKFFEAFKLQKYCEINSAHPKVFGAS